MGFAPKLRPSSTQAPRSQHAENIASGVWHTPGRRRFPVNTKAKGARNERRARALLESSGYTVIRAGASLGLFDLVAFGRSDIALVQVKSNRGPGAAELARLAAFDKDRKSTRLNSSHRSLSRMPSSA